jgi:putative transcriptional regulator
MKTRIKEYRRKNDYTQAKLAEELGITTHAVALMESGKKDTPVSLAHKMANLFDTSIEELFEFEDGAHTMADKAIWLSKVIEYTAEEMETSVDEMIDIFKDTGLASRVLAGYSVWHTQGYEYMAEMLSDDMRGK